VASYAEAYNRLRHLAGTFFVCSLIATLLSFINSHWWVGLIWLTAGSCVVGLSRPTPQLSDSLIIRRGNGVFAEDATINKGAEQAFARQFLTLSFMISLVAMASAFAIERCWWSSVLFALTSWFSSMLIIPVICAPIEMSDE
jgi:hypothetical protein